VTVLAEYEQMRRRHRWTVPERYNIAADVCDKHPSSRLAMIYAGPGEDPREIRWGELQDLTGRWAHVLSRRGVSRGDRVAVLLAPGPETAAVLLATLKVGAVAVTMSRLWSDDSISYRLADCDPRVVVTDAEGIARTPLLDHPGTLDVQQVDLDALPTVFPTVETLADDPAMIYYTSGSTGHPKGIVSPHRALLGHNEFTYCQDLRPGERSYWMGDWAWGVYKVLGPWRLAAVNVVQVTRDRYDPERLLSFLSRTRSTNLFLNPTGLRLMSQVPGAGRRYPVHVRVCCSANEPLGDEEAAWFRDEYGVEILQNYGMTEAYPMVGNFLSMPVKRGSIGRPVPGWDVQVLDDEGRQVLPGQPGEICLRARSNPQFPLGYWRRPDDTQRDFGGEWFHTKDSASVDEDGYFWYLGRSDDLIKTAGYRLSPYEVEAVCKQMPGIRDVAVIGVPDGRRGQQVKAFVVPAEGAEPGQELATRVKEFVKAHHSAFGYPRIVEFVAELPTSQSGKVVRTPLRTRPPGAEY
jgi:acetyl-CoA synthetase